MSNPSIQDALATAMQHQQAGRLREAEVIYRQILVAQPNHPDALHLLGIIAFQSGRSNDAEELIRRAIAANPGAA
jgi:Flp pilus assembly protein TadD